VFAIAVLVYYIKMEGTPIFELVSGAYQVPLVGAFVPLVFGLYWKRATTQGALCATVLGIGVWVLFMATPALHEAFPQQLAGVLAAVVGMVAGSLVPQWVHHRPASHHAIAENKAHPIIEGFSQAPFPPVCLSMPTNAAPVAMPRMCCKKSPMPR
jgi:Na+/proline symporter